MKKYLRCVQGNSSFTEGKRYEIVRENRTDYSVRNDAGWVELFSKKPDDNGLSYRDWFTLEPEEDAPITVLPDESLGGVMREYREVKRKAAVGEWIKIVNAWYTGGKYWNGDLLTVSAFYGGNPTTGIVQVSGISTDENFGGQIDFREYLVLEPSDILVIDGARYRMVDRKAAVGDQVLVTNAVSDAPEEYGYDTGQLYTVMGYTGSDPDIWPDGTGDSAIFLDRDEYRVLEPVNSGAEPQLSALPASDQIAENIAALAARVTGLEAKVSELGEAMRAVIEAGNPAELSVSSAQAETWTKVASGPVNTKLPSYLSPQQIRDEIVERAKADVKALEARAQNGKFDTPATSYRGNLSVEFVVNREARTVVALLRLFHCPEHRKVYAKGIAKCAPDDVFNVHIGKAIALRRALGLEVPTEYLSAPNPEEVRVGDVITDKFGRKSGKVVSFEPGSLGSPGLTYDYPNPNRHDGHRWANLDYVSIIEDSREEVAA